MAQPISDEELQLKKRARRRLVGAVALVTLVVIFLPMVLESEPKPVGQDIAIRIPSQDDGNIAAKSLSAGAQPAAPAPAPPPAAQPEPAAAQPATIAGAAPVAPAAPHPAEKIPENAAPAPAPQKSVQTMENGAKPQFVVLLGAFSSTANAKQRQAKLATLGVKFYSETAKTPGGEKIRVRAGPYPSRLEAEKVRDMLKGKGIQDGMVAEK